MKTTSAIIRLIVCLLTAAILTALLAAGILFGSGKLNIGGILKNIVYDNEETYTAASSASIDSAAPAITSIDVNWICGSVEIKNTTDKNISFSEEGATDDDSTMRYRINDGKLTIQFAKSRRFGIKSLPEKKLVLCIPEDVKLDTLRVSAVEANTNIDKVATKQITFESVSGDLVASDSPCEVLNAHTVSGSVNFLCGDSITDAISQFDFETVSGGAKITTLRAPMKVDCDGVSGNVTLSFSECDGFTVDIDKISGELESDFNTAEKDGKHIYGDGTAQYSFDTVSGRFSIFDRAAHK